MSNTVGSRKEIESTSFVKQGSRRQLPQIIILSSPGRIRTLLGLSRGPTKLLAKVCHYVAISYDGLLPDLCDNSLGRIVQVERGTRSLEARRSEEGDPAGAECCYPVGSF